MAGGGGGGELGGSRMGGGGRSVELPEAGNAVILEVSCVCKSRGPLLAIVELYYLYAIYRSAAPVSMLDIADAFAGQATGVKEWHPSLLPSLLLVS